MSSTRPDERTCTTRSWPCRTATTLVHETFSELRGSVTIFAIAHRLSTLNSCDRIMVMHHGRVQAFGTRSELERTSEFYRDALALSQIRS